MTSTDLGHARKLVYGLLITVAAGLLAGHILCAELVLEPSLHRDPDNPASKGRVWPAKRPRSMPTFSSNDRSRWATVYALVEDGTYVIGRRDRQVVLTTAILPLAAQDPFQAAALARTGLQLRITADDGIIFRDGWQSVDKILHPSTLEFYSTKPPLLSTLIAGLYWLIRSLTGWNLDDTPAVVVRLILLLVNWLPFLGYLVLLTRLVERYGRSDWGRFYVLAAGAFGTLVTVFGITLNNHSVATYCVMAAIYLALGIWESRCQVPYGTLGYALAGFLAGFAVCNELPALAFAAGLFLVLLACDVRKTLLVFVPLGLLPLVALLLTNYLALGELRPAYSHFGGPWYEYEGSFWVKPLPGQVKDGIDFAYTKESRLAYAVHVLFGHHGLFTLTPIWILAAFGLWLGMRGRGKHPGTVTSGQLSLPGFVVPLTLFLSVVVIGFYLFRSDNYGGWTNGLRWLMWLTPMWLLSLLPAADRLATSRPGRGLGYLLLGVSVLSANYVSWNPWRHPWLYELLVTLGWPGY